MSALCIDIGNTTTHLGLVQNGEVKSESRIPTNQLVEKFSATVQEYPSASLLAYCSVVPKANAIIQEVALANQLKVFNLIAHP